MSVITRSRLDSQRHVEGLVELPADERHTHQLAAEADLAQRARRMGLELGAVTHDWRLAGVHARREGDQRPPTGVHVLKSSAHCGVLAQHSR